MVTINKLFVKKKLKTNFIHANDPSQQHGVKGKAKKKS